MKPAPQPELAPLFPRLSMLMKELPPFLRDTHLRWNTRTFYLNNSGGEDPRREAWALGGSLTYRSGKLWDLLSVGATLFTSQKLIGKKSRDGTLLLRERQRSYTVVGESYARLERFGLQATFYRQELDLPYVNKRDGRMTPNTYEAYTLRGIYEDVFGLDRVQFIAGHITDMKERNSDRFKSMSEIAGVDGSSHGLTTAGFLIQPFEKFYLGTVNHYVKDTLNTSYSSADYTWSVTDELASRFQAQFTHQRSVGDDDLTGRSFATWVLGGRASLSYKHLIVSGAFSVTDDEQRIRSPWGSYPGYIGLMQKNFNRAQEKAWLVGLSYNFSRIGVPGLSLFLDYAEGYDAIDGDTRESLPDRREFDITVDYRLEREGWFDGLWFRVRGSILDVEGASRNANDVRVIVNWPLPLL